MGVSGSSMVMLNHLTQMKMFANRQGIEFFPDQDDEQGSRMSFIQQVVSSNEMELHYDRFLESMLLSGQILIYWRPNSKGSYDIRIFDKSSFKAFYNLEQKLEKVIIRFFYYEQSGIGGSSNGAGGGLGISPSSLGGGVGQRIKKWCRMTITATEILQEFTGEGQILSWDSGGVVAQKQVIENTLGFIPCVIAKNNSLGIGQDGVGEFEPFNIQMERLEYMQNAMEENLAFFGNPILAATRSPNELLEITSFKSPNLNKAHTLSSEAGWYGNGMESTRKSMPRNDFSAGANLRLKKVIGNISETERFQFINPPPVSVDHARYIQQAREALHFALGGIDETGIHASATAYEMKVVYGKCATTALKKARALYEYGFCKVFENMILVEENLFRKTLALALKKDVGLMTDEFINDLLTKSGGLVPDGVFGLPPLGKRKVNWRWTGPVFEDSPDDVQKRSIVVRNLQELGVRSLDALTFLFPDKTLKEKQGMLAGGYPFRYLNAVAGTTGQLLGLYGQMTQLPSQGDPSMPMASQMPVEPMIQKSLETIYNELSYARPTESSSSSESPYTTGNSAYQQWLQSIQSSTQSSNQSSSTGSVPIPTGGYGSIPSSWGQFGQSVPSANGITQSLPTTGNAYGSGSIGSSYGGIKPPDYVTGLPAAGTTVISTSKPNWASGSDSFAGSSAYASAGIPADLAIDADKPNSIWQQLSQSALSGSGSNSGVSGRGNTVPTKSGNRSPKSASKSKPTTRSSKPN